MQHSSSGDDIQFRVPLIAKLLYVLTSGFTEQNFLGNASIPFLLKICPKKHRRNLALRLLGISPHYFIYQWSTKYDQTLSRREILELEYKRNLASRKEICEKLLRQHMRPHMTVLDFGCGPGYLAKEVSKYVKKVLAIDISCGVIACAKELNNDDNVQYLTSLRDSPYLVDGACVDLVYSFAVVQHLSDELFEEMLKDIFYLVKPQGRVICHVAIDDGSQPGIEQKKSLHIEKFIRDRYALRMVRRPVKNIIKKIMTAGFKDPSVLEIKQLAEIEDTIAKQHLFVFSKP